MSGRISFAQADALAKHTHTPLGYLYLREPQTDHLPIPDFRSGSDVQKLAPSPDLLDTVYLMVRRQDWMREDLMEEGADLLPFVGCCDSDATADDVASKMHRHLGLSGDWASKHPSWDVALRRLRERIEECGVMVVFNGIVGNNTHRKLDRLEFQGFALVDCYAPLIFVNSADHEEAHMFTLAHELAHVFLGATGVSQFGSAQATSHKIEQFCNRIAAAFLVPESELYKYWTRVQTLPDSLQLVAKRFTVSEFVAAIRMLHLDMLRQGEFLEIWDELEHGKPSRPTRAIAGDFWNSQRVRIGHHFGHAVGRAVRQGRLSYREAYSLTGLWGDTFEKFLESLEEGS